MNDRDDEVLDALLKALKPLIDRVERPIRLLVEMLKDMVASKKNHFEGYRKPTEREHKYIKRILAAYRTIFVFFLTFGTIMLILVCGMVAYGMFGNHIQDNIKMVILFFIMLIATVLYGKSEIGRMLKIRKSDYEVLEGTAVYTYHYSESRNIPSLSISRCAFLVKITYCPE